jgi:hypothetical protein
VTTHLRTDRVYRVLGRSWILKNLMESLMRMLQAITNGEGKHIKY